MCWPPGNPTNRSPSESTRCMRRTDGSASQERVDSQVLSDMMAETGHLLPASRCRRRSGDLLLPGGVGFFLPAGVGPAPEVAGDLRCFPAVVHAAPSAAAVLAVVNEQEPACVAWLDVAARPVG